MYELSSKPPSFLRREREREEIEKWETSIYKKYRETDENRLGFYLFNYSNEYSSCHWMLE